MSSEAQALRERVGELEDRLDTLTRAQAEYQQGVSNGEGTWTMGQLMNWGLTRRQAVSAMVAIAGGAALPVALSEAVKAQPTGDEGQVGQSGDRVEVWASEIDATEIATDDLGIGSADFVASGDFVACGPSFMMNQNSVSTTNTSYTEFTDDFRARLDWDSWVPANTQIAVTGYFRVLTSAGDVRLLNFDQSEVIFEEADVSAGTNVQVGPTNYTPAASGTADRVQMELRTNDGGTATEIQNFTVVFGIQL